MFNGIIFNKGSITKILKRPKGINIFIKSNLKLSMKDIGISVACDGVCLTLIRIKNKIAPKLMKSESKTSKTIFIPMGIFMEFNQIRFEKEVIGTMSKVSINVANKYREKFLNKIFTVQNFSVRKSHSIINPHYAQKFYFFNFSFI